MAASFGNNVVFWKTCIVFMGVTLSLALISFQQVEAGRPFGILVEPWLMKNNLIIQSLPRGSGTTPSGNPCTYIPGSTKGRCTLAENEENVGARRFHVGIAPPAFPEVKAKFAAASNDKVNDHDHDHLQKDQSSS